MGFIGIDRGIEDHWIYQDAEYFKVWFEILLRTRYSPEPERKLIEGKLVTIEYGQFIFGRVSWSDRLKISERRIRTLMDKLIADDMISLSSKFPKFTIYSVINYAKYNTNFDHHSDQQEYHAGQRFATYSDHQKVQQATSKRPASDQQATTQEQGINKELYLSTSTTTGEQETISDVNRKIFGTLMMSGMLQGFVIKYKDKGFTDKFIIEVLYEAAETCNGGAPSIKFIETIAERWERDGIYSRYQNKQQKAGEMSEQSRGRNSKVTPLRNPRAGETLFSDDELDELNRASAARLSSV